LRSAGWSWANFGIRVGGRGALSAPAAVQEGQALPYQNLRYQVLYGVPFVGAEPLFVGDAQASGGRREAVKPRFRLIGFKILGEIPRLRVSF